MTHEQLKEHALSLPAEPGVYIMRDKANDVIYVGKAKKLKNRVTQYFQDTASHTAKTKLLVSKIDRFDVIIAASEFEALVLECSLIKQHLPKYNILLKDDKGYPYLRLDMNKEYPVVTLENKHNNDGAEYYGPFGSRGVTNGILQTLRATLKLPGCNKQFPRDIGKGRVCLNYHMDQCCGWCQGKKSKDEYRKAMEQVRQLLSGNYRSVAGQIKARMLDAAERMDFELAAGLRDQLNAVEALGKKQLVTAGSLIDTDVIGYGKTSAKACFSVLHFSDGKLVDKDYEIITPAFDDAEAVSSLLKQYYLGRGFAPKQILLPFSVEDTDLFEKLLEKRYSRRTKFHVPQRGDNTRLVELANKNAYEEAERASDKEEKISGTLQLLGNFLSIAPPKRIESYDISNISGTDIVASMVVFECGRPCKSAYKRFKLEGLDGQDDYASMYQTLKRRFDHFCAGDKGFSEKPDLLLIDGGVAHANVALRVLQELPLSVPVFGMVKDERHRTRSLVSPQGHQIGIDSNQSVFSFIGTVQEETHRFAITYHRQLRSKRLQYSELDSIPGIGSKRKQLLLKQFGSLVAISRASLSELERLLPKDAALSVYRHFQEKGEK